VRGGIITFAWEIEVITRLPETGLVITHEKVITTKSACPYFSMEQREQWHKERGIEDPQKAIIQREVRISSVPDGMTKEERYRARNREKLALKAKARRATK
jgi:hypothetical protein